MNAPPGTSAPTPFAERLSQNLFNLDMADFFRRKLMEEGEYEDAAEGANQKDNYELH